ncbi:MAG: hypothetical protein ACI9LY_001859 [Arenicella sp.]|jgi:hypothetical protein
MLLHKVHLRVSASWVLSNVKVLIALSDVLGESKAVFQTTPYNESPVTAIFDISGIDNAIKPIQSNCGWRSKPGQIKASQDFNQSQDYDKVTRDTYQACKHQEGCYSKVLKCQSNKRDIPEFIACMNK